MEKTPEYLIDHPKKAVEFLKDMPPPKRKGVLASLIVFIGDKDKDTKGAGALTDLRQLMKDDITVYNTQQKKQKMSEKDAENWIDWSDVLSMLKTTWKHDGHLVRKSGKLSKDEKKRLLNLVLISIYAMIPPRRSEDYTHFKIRNVDAKKDNHMSNKGFVFTTYKTAKTYGEQVVSIPKKLRTLVEAIASRDDWGDYLLSSVSGHQISSAQLTGLLNKLFDKKVSTSLLRKSYLTDRYKNIPELEDIAETENAMGNEFSTQLRSYVKPNANKKEK